MLLVEEAEEEVADMNSKSLTDHSALLPACSHLIERTLDKSTTDHFEVAAVLED